MKKLLLILLFLPFIGFGQIDIGNNQAVCEGSSALLIATYAPGTSLSWTGSPILITECDPGNPDILEIQNVSSGPVDVTGWRVIISNSYTDINLSNPNEQVLSGIMTPSETKDWTDQAGAINYWGSNMMWNPGVYPSFTTWIILLDDNNNVMDIFVGNWLAADIASSSITISNGAVISMAGHWNGDGVDQTTIGTTLQSFSRIGNDDNNDASDFIITSTTAAVTNSGLNLPFSGGGAAWYDQSNNQLIGVGDTINYLPLQSTYILAEITDTLGQLWVDSMYLEVLNTNISTTGFSLCNGPVILTAPTNFSTYTWNNGASATGILTVSSPGIYYVDYITSNGLTCQSDSITIYSGNIPISLSTPDSVFICQGDTVVIDGPSGFTAYNWSTGATTTSITTMSTGTYNLSVVDGNGCTGTSNTTSINISPPTINVTTTANSLCNGPVTLNAGSGFATYQWFNSGVMMPGNTQTLLVSTAGAYHCEVIYPTGCTATSDTLNIVAGSVAFNVIIAAIGADSLCEPNGQVMLDAGNYASFLWSTGETTQVISVTTLGSYLVDVIDSSGCEGSSNIAFEVFDAVNTSAILGPTNPTQFQTVTYFVSPTSGSTYNWSIIGGVIQSGIGTNSIDVIWDNAGMFSLSVIETNIDGCLGEEMSILVTVIGAPSAIKEVNSSKRLNKIIDVLGQEIPYRKNTNLFYIYDDGTVEKRIIIE